jgi:2,4-dienoyl-CoA reductase-like NADH-dependent reductase (Old Yellow Enzyme family)/NADPH-dependent 2,4-dienoyl-CoA reductase/sulfur reductase-like enzyme
MAGDAGVTERSARLRRLLEPGRIGSMRLKNRITMAPMGTQMYAEGFVTEQLKDYYEARARGGVSLITIDHLKISYPVGAGKKNTARIDHDKFVPGLAQLLDVVHRYDVRMVAQLGHMGPADIATEGRQPLAASGLMRQADYTHPPASVVDYSRPRAMTRAEIAQVTEQFVQAARRAQRAGFDAVQIHAANRYLLASFVSPYWNRRDDEYGGDLANRARFTLEVVRAVRAAVGPDYPILCRVNGEERDVEGGVGAELAAQFCRLLQEAGVDGIDVSSMHPHSPEYAPGFNVAAAAAIKQAVTIPVNVAGRLDPVLGEELLRQGKCDFVTIGRPLIADPELPNKAAAGRLDDAVPCVYCVNCLAVDRECTVNPAWGKERAHAIVPASARRRVMVIGGGPGGMEAARVAALRGHEVTLYERESALGGQLRLASLLREEYAALVRYLARQMDVHGVRLELGREVDAALVERADPDAVVVATGARAVTPDIPGRDRANVYGAADIRAMMQGRLSADGGGKKLDARRLASYAGLNLLRSSLGTAIARRVLEHWTPFGKRVVIVGRGLPGIELAHFLAERGAEVALIDTREDLPFGQRPMPVLREYMNAELARHGAVKHRAQRYERIDERGLVFVDEHGDSRTLAADSVIFAADFRPNDELAPMLRAGRRELHFVGDCSRPCGILDAIHGGAQAGRAV